MSLIRQLVNFLNGFRKFTVMILLMLVGVVFLISGHLSGSEFVKLLSSTAVAFMSANVVEHISTTVTTWVQTKIKR